MWKRKDWLMSQFKEIVKEARAKRMTNEIDVTEHTDDLLCACRRCRVRGPVIKKAIMSPLRAVAYVPEEPLTNRPIETEEYHLAKWHLPNTIYVKYEYRKQC
jgi:hypothetical protein